MIKFPLNLKSIHVQFQRDAVLYSSFYYYFQNLIEVIPDSLGTEESTEAPSVETPTDETTAATSDSSESTSETSETSESSESNETGRINIADCVNATESCESDEYFFQGIGDDGLHTVDNLMAPDDGERELQLRR